jgi:HlyD family secretion protein
MQMRKWIIILGATALVAVGAWWVIANQGSVETFISRPLAESGPTTDSPVRASRAIAAEAKLTPLQYADLSMAASGLVDEVLVVEGQSVQAGDVIVRLMSDRETIAIAQAQASVEKARAHLEKLLNGPLPEEIAAAQAGVDAAMARLALLQEGARPEDIAISQAALAAAQASYQQVAAGPDDGALIAAQAELENARAALQQAQNAYNRVSWRGDIGALPEAAALQQASNNFEAAQARYDDLAAGADVNQLARAGAEVRQARASLERVQASATANEIAAAEAEVRRAQAQLDLLMAGARPEDIAAARSDLVQAETVAMQQQLALADKELRAPFAGVIAGLDLRSGQQVAAGVPVAQLADTSAWLVETSDLTEISVVDVHEGDRVEVQVDALPEMTFSGVVERIKPLGENVQGDITYKATIRLDENDPRLRWNMTAAVLIEPDDKNE